MARSIITRAKIDKFSPLKPLTSLRKNSLSSHKYQDVVKILKKTNIEEYKWTGVMTQASFLLRTHNFKSQIIKDMNENIMNKIIFYVKDNCFVKFKELFERTKVDIEYKDADGNTLLNHSSQADSYEISDYLVHNGADLNTQNVILNTIFFIYI